MTTTEIVMCGVCNGRGAVECRELTDYHKNEYDHWDEMCPKCEGSGRLVIETTSTTKPYEVPEFLFRVITTKGKQ